MDETTDISSDKALARVYDKNHEHIRDRFLGLIGLLKTDAQTI